MITSFFESSITSIYIGWLPLGKDLEKWNKSMDLMPDFLYTIQTANRIIMQGRPSILPDS